VTFQVRASIHIWSPRGISSSRARSRREAAPSWRPGSASDQIRQRYWDGFQTPPTVTPIWRSSPPAPIGPSRCAQSTCFLRKVYTVVAPTSPPSRTGCRCRAPIRARRRVCGRQLTPAGEAATVFEIYSFSASSSAYKLRTASSIIGWEMPWMPHLRRPPSPPP
jgi:hypothetical protein